MQAAGTHLCEEIVRLRALDCSAGGKSLCCLVAPVQHSISALCVQITPLAKDPVGKLMHVSTLYLSSSDHACNERINAMQSRICLEITSAPSSQMQPRICLEITILGCLEITAGSDATTTVVQ